MATKIEKGLVFSLLAIIGITAAEARANGMLTFPDEKLPFADISVSTSDGPVVSHLKVTRKEADELCAHGAYLIRGSLFTKESQYGCKRRPLPTEGKAIET